MGPDRGSFEQGCGQPEHRPGGDAEGALGRHLNPFKRKTDKPVAYWSGIVDVIWIGRRRIPGIEPGRVIRANGRISEREGRRVIFNPKYELLPAGS